MYEQYATRRPDKNKTSAEDRLDDLTACAFQHAEDIDLLIERLQDLEKHVKEDLKRR